MTCEIFQNQTRQGQEPCKKLNRNGVKSESKMKCQEHEKLKVESLKNESQLT